MIVFQVSLNLDPVKEILKVQCQIYIQWRKWLFWRKYKWQWRISFHYFPTILVWAWAVRKRAGNESREKETKYVFTSVANLLHIWTGNRNWYKCGHCKNEAREVDCLCCMEIEVDAMLINPYSPNVTFLCPNVTFLCSLSVLPFQGVQKCNIGRIWVSLAKIPQREGSILLSSFYGELPDYQSRELALST